jgi:hypothetical protein
MAIPDDAPRHPGYGPYIVTLGLTRRSMLAIRVRIFFE